MRRALSLLTRVKPNLRKVQGLDDEMVTIRDVARTAGVSIKTVSRVLTGNGYASAATRAQVERAAKKLGYVPNRIASSLASGRTLSIGMIVPDISSAYFSEVALGAETIATKASYNLILCNTNGRPEQEKQVQRPDFGGLRQQK